MRDIFLSYRRADSSDVTGRILDRMKMRFGEARLFIDVDAIPLGTDFRAVISKNIDSCKVLLAIIGDDWLEVTNDDGSRRLFDPEDYVHIEIATALSREIPVIPILVESSSVPNADELPDPLKELAYRNGISVRPDPDFDNDIERLCTQLSEYIDTGSEPAGETSSRRSGYLRFLDAAIAQQKNAIRFYTVHSAAVVVLGLLTIVFALSVGESYREFLATGGAFLSALAGYPVKQILDRKQRLNGLDFLRAEVDSLDTERLKFAIDRLAKHLDATLGM